MYKKLTECLCCNGKNLESILDLNFQPLANSYLTSKEDLEDYYPLGINFCTDCTHVQLTHAVDPDKLFKEYLYVSGTTKTLKKYFDWFVQLCSSYTSGKTVLDIACNDGTQLDSFKSLGYQTYGIDPAKNLYSLSSANHNVICDYLTDDSIKKFDTKFDIIIAQNVFAHNTYPQQFLEICKNYLNTGGHLFIQTSQADMIQNNQFDTIYHEHISFFSVKSFCTLAKRVGLSVVDVKRSDIHGTSFIFVLSNDGTDLSDSFILKEKELYLEGMYKYANSCKLIASETSVTIDTMRSDGIKVIGYGAAAKGNTFLNFAKISLDYIVDDNPLKQGLYTPGSKIPIYSPDTLLKETEPLCIVPLAWNFFDEIKQNVLDRSIVCKFLKYFPKVEII